MARFQESWAVPVTDKIASFYYDEYYVPLIELTKNPLFNSQSDLINALRSGQVRYSNGFFTGTFNITLSRELSGYAKYDGLRKHWKVTGLVPSPVLTAAVTSLQKTEGMLKAMNVRIGDLEQKIPELIDELNFNVGNSVNAITGKADQTLIDLGVTPDFTPEWEQQIEDRYTENMQFNIKDFHEEQITRLRGMVKDNVLVGFDRPFLLEQIRKEFEISFNKAKFWARNETMLLTSAIRDERYQDAGIQEYIWSTIMDGRERDLHGDLNGKRFSYNSPPIIDERTGKRGNPGEIYNCRCTAKPVLPGQ